MPLLPLDTFRAALQWHPWHFWGWASAAIPVASKGMGLLTEYAWQDTDRLSRSDIRQALESAEDKLREALGYSVAPRYDEQTITLPRPAQAALSYRAPIQSGGRWQSVRLRQEGFVQALGVESLVLIDDAVALTRTDPDGDDLKELFTLTCTVPAGTTADEVAVYVALADRIAAPSVSAEIGARWRVEPVRVSIAGTTATITGPAWLLARPVLYQGVTNIGAGLDPATASNYVTTLDVYRRRTNGDGTTEATAQGVLTWETAPGSCCGASNDSSTDPAGIATAIARVGLRDARLGWVVPGEAAYNATSGTWDTVDWSACRQPDHVLIRFYAGLPLVDQQMDPQWRDVVAHLAAAELPRPGRGADTANHWLAHYQFDLARSSGANDEAYAGISPEYLNNPFGSRRGQVEAWRRVISGDYLRRGSAHG